MTIAIVAAENFELAGLRRRFTEMEPETSSPIRHAYRAQWQGRTVVLRAHGPGFQLAAAAARDAAAAAPDRIWNIGLCGGLQERLREGDVVTASKVVDRGTGESFRAIPFEGTPAATVVSQDRVALSVAEKAALAAHGDVVDMEAAAVAREAERLGIPFQCLKVVSDTAREGFRLDWNRVRAADGRFPLARVLEEALRHPFRAFPELAHLYRRSRAGAERLGDWLANCVV